MGWCRAAFTSPATAATASPASTPGTSTSPHAARPKSASSGRTTASRVPASRKRQWATICDHSGAKSISRSASVPPFYTPLISK
jgi:hypothetical protein